MEQLNEQEFCDALMSVIESADNDEEGNGSPFEDCGGIRSMRDFQDAGLLTSNRGIVVRLNDGSEFQITVVRR